MTLKEKKKIVSKTRKKAKELRKQGYIFEEIAKLLGLKGPSHVYYLCNTTDFSSEKFHKFYKKKPIRFAICPTCGKKFQIRSSRHIYCSKKCNPIKFGGRDSIREKIRIRDNHTCRLCGKVWQKKERRLDVHHLTYNDDGSYKQGKNMDEWITVCHKCHMSHYHKGINSK